MLQKCPECRRLFLLEGAVPKLGKKIRCPKCTPKNAGEKGKNP